MLIDKIRHLPVEEMGAILGLVSISDMDNSVIVKLESVKDVLK